MVVVGLTGGIGAGKSSVSARLERLGAAVIDADAVTRELQQPGQPVLAAIVERFGPGVLLPDGSLDRAALAAIVFGDDGALAALNAIVHPAVGAEMLRRLGEAREAGRIAVLDIPLLTDRTKYPVDAVIVVDVDPEVAVQRLVAFRGFSEADARARIKAQISREERLALADRVIDNSGDLAALDRAVDEVWAWLLTLDGAAAPTEATEPSPHDAQEGARP